MKEGNLVKWLKQEGDTVRAGDVLAEIETDKATMEVEAVDEGVLGKILVAAGTENVAVNAPIAVILEDGETLEDITLPSTTTSASPAPIVETPSPSATASQSATASSASSHPGSRPFASPLARRIADQAGVSLNAIEGTGPKGRIIKHDVETFLSTKPASSPAPSAITAAASFGDSAFEDLPLNNMRKVIAKRLTQAKQEVPHFYLTVDCQLDALLGLRQEMNKRLSSAKVSVNDFIVRACALALQDVPDANTAWLGDVIRRYQASDVCVAVAIEGGLVTPIVRSAHLKSLVQISEEVKTLAENARAGKLKPEAYQGGSFTISNLGMYGIKHFNAILNPPQACILAVGAGEKRAVVLNNAVSIVTVMTCTLSVDHRAVDGAIGAAFLAAFKGYIEDPLKLLI